MVNNLAFFEARPFAIPDGASSSTHSAAFGCAHQAPSTWGIPPRFGGIVVGFQSEEEGEVGTIVQHEGAKDVCWGESLVSAGLIGFWMR